MTLKEQIIWTVLGIENTDTLKEVLNLVENFRQQELVKQETKPDPKSFLPDFSGIKIITVEEALSPHYAYPRFSKETIVGQWPSDEPVDELLQMLKS